MHAGYVYEIRSQVKVTPNKLEERDEFVLAHSLAEAMALYEAAILPETVYHYRSVAEHCECLH